MKNQKSKKVFTVLRYILLGGILGYLVAEAVIHGFISRYAQVPAFHALCPFESFGSFLNSVTGLEFFNNPLASASIFLLFLILFAILLNRVFCGFLCAFGALQEFVGILGNKLLKKRFVIPVKVDKILRVLKYVFLVLSIGLAYLTGYEFFSNLFAQGSDAFSYINPWIAFKSLLSNNLLITGYIGSLAVLVISLAGSFFFQRFYCKYICPLGGLFAIFGSLSGLHIFRNVKPADEAECSGNCSECAMNCSCDEISEECDCDDEVNDDESVEVAEVVSEDFNAAEDVSATIETNDEIVVPEETLADEPKAGEEGTEAEDEEDSDEYSEEYNEYDEEEAEDEEIIEDDYCINCGKCSEVCPMGIDVASVDGNIDFAECISCQKCVAACPKKGALQTRYFKKRINPIWVIAITFVVFFGAVFAFNFIKIDRGGEANEPIYDSIRVAPKAPSTAAFSVKDIMDEYGMTLDELKDYLSLSDSLTEDASYSEYINSYTLKYFKENDEDRYNDLLSHFGLTAETPLDTSLADIYNNATISLTADYLGFDPEKMDEFAAYFGSTPDQLFGTISEKYYEMYDEYMVFAQVDQTEFDTYVAKYGYWYQCDYGAKLKLAQNYYELCEKYAYVTDIQPLMLGDRFTIQYLLDSQGMTLSELMDTYHLKQGAVTPRSAYSDFSDAVMLSYYKETYAAEESGEDEFLKMIQIYGLTNETVDLNMTVGELLESGNVKQAAQFFGYETDEDINGFIEQYEGVTAESPYSAIHEQINQSMDDYYDMMYQYYSQSY